MSTPWKPLALVTGMLALLTYCLFESRSADPVHQALLHAALQTFEVHDAELNRDVLLARAGLTGNYDALAQTACRSAGGLGRSAPLHGGRAVRGAGNAGTAGGGTDRAVGAKLAQVEHFKSDNALLRNSMMYFVYAGDGLRARAVGEGQAALAAEVGGTAQAMLGFMQAPRHELGMEIEAKLARLQPVAPFAAELGLLATHGRLIVQVLPAVDATLREIAAAPTTAGARAVRGTLMQYAGQSEARAQRFRVLLYLVAVVLLAYLIHLFSRLRANALDLRRANADLRREISERQQVEERLRHAQKMEAIGTLAGGIAHDFNNLLGPILGYAEMALNGLPADARPRRYLEQVISAGQRAKGVVNQILTFSRRSETVRKPLAIEAVIAEAVQLLRAALPASIEVRSQLAAPDAVVNADATQLHQVLMNLGGNAAHAMAGKGILLIELEPVLIDQALALTRSQLTPGRYVRLSVHDSGHGMDAATRERIFEPFFTTKDIGKGTGLGLAIVHGIVAGHGGAIHVYSEPGQGATFQVYLPCADSAADASSVAEPLTMLGNGEVILFVDDDPTLLKLGEEMLAALGYEPVGYGDSRAALAAFQADPARFDLVITDQIMPQLLGTELAEQIIEIRADIPILLISGHAGLSDQETPRGVRLALKKPLLIRELAEGIAHVLSATRAHS
ncbi:MAG: DAHL domain-containing protein [Gammaproteobacteria bacterium]